MKKFITIAVLGLALTGSVFAQGPFGFERGMTREQIIKLVGSDAVDKEHSNPELMIVKTAALNPHFQMYGLFFSPTQGLLKIAASGNDIETGDAGFELRTEFKDLVEIITQKYGQPTAKHTTMTSTGSEYWMLDLKQKNVTWSAYWLGNGYQNSITAISVSIEVVNIQKGYCMLDYEFEGWKAFVDSKTAKQNQSF